MTLWPVPVLEDYRAFGSMIHLHAPRGSEWGEALGAELNTLFAASDCFLRLGLSLSSKLCPRFLDANRQLSIALIALIASSASSAEK